ncbi:MAG: Hpt domain-containing protein [Burkholderiales bacterium]
MTILDESVLRQLHEELGRATFEEALRVFLGSARSARNDIGACVAGGDTAPLAQIAHKFKSSSLMFGGLEVAAQARRLEALARVDPAGALADAPALADALRRVESRLESYLGSIDDPHPIPRPRDGPAGPDRSR